MRAPVFILDTSVMVAAVCVWHQHHHAASEEIHLRLGRGERLAIPAPALAETYSVLTRLPSPYRLAPADAWELIETNFIQAARVVGLSGPTYVRLLARCAKQQVVGGRAYDAVIAECAKQAKIPVLLTFNGRHFESLLDSVAVIEPSRTGRP
jgi:predicted nucleic acid-binding protein